MPETTIALVVARLAPKIAFLSTASPIRSRLRTNRSAGVGWRRVFPLMTHHRVGRGLNRLRDTIRSPSTRSNTLVEPDAVEGGTGQGDTGKFPQTVFGLRNSVSMPQGVLMQTCLPVVDFLQNGLGANTDRIGKLVSRDFGRLLSMRRTSPEKGSE